MSQNDFRDFIAEVKCRLSIDQIIGEVVDLKPKAGTLWGNCPFHNEKSASFHVYPARGYWHCFGCQEGGDLVAFVQKFEGLDFWSAICKLAERAGVEIPSSKEGDELAAEREKTTKRKRLYETLGAAADYYAGQLPPKLIAGALKKWGLTEETLRAHKIGYASGSGLVEAMNAKGFSLFELCQVGLMRGAQSLSEVFQNRLMVPFYRGGECIYFTGRDCSKESQIKYLKLPKHSEKWPLVDPQIGDEGVLLYDALTPPRHQGPVIVCEGTFDALAVWQVGLPAIGLQTTAASPSAKRDLLKLGRRRGLILCFDADKAGIKGALALGEQLHRVKVDVRILSLPKSDEIEKLDVAEFLRDNPKEKFIELLEGAPRVPDVKLSLASPDLAGADLDNYLKDLCLDLNAAPLADRDRMSREVAGKLKLKLKTVEAYLKAAELETGFKFLGNDPPTPPPKVDPKEPPKPPKKRLPEIEITVDSEALVDAAEKLLPSLAIPVYSYGGQLSTVLSESLGGVEDARPQRLTTSRLSTLLDSAALWSRVRNDKKEYAAAPQKIVESLSDRGYWPSIPTLQGIASTPFLRPDGEVCQKRGFDAETSIYLAPAVEEVEVSDQPTLVEERDALLLLLGVVQDFPFATAACRAAWLALVLTLLARPSFEGPSPGFLFDANIRGTGKTLLGELAAYIGTGSTAPFKRAYPHDNDEMNKSLLAIARGARRYVLFDEVRALGGDSINFALTSTTYGGRILGESEDTTLPLNAVFAFTGNNVKLVGDVDRRLLSIRLLSPDERPENRGDFAIPDLVAYVKSDRGRLTSAALTLLRGAVTGKAGRDTKLSSWQSYLGWSAVVRGTIGRYVPYSQTLGPKFALDDPANARPSPEDMPEGVYFSMLLEGIDGLTTSKGSTAATLLDMAYRDTSISTGNAAKLREALEYLTSTPAGKRPTIRAAGNLFARLRERNVGGRKLVGLPKGNEGVPWAVTKI